MRVKDDDGASLHGREKGSGLHGRAEVVLLDEVLGRSKVQLLQVVRVQMAAARRSEMVNSSPLF
jgi:hypothetical protein